METRPIPLTRDLVLIGGGHAHALVLRRWGMRPLPGARLTLINPGPTAPYTGMLPGHVAGHYGRDDLEIDLVRLARFAGARLILGMADGIDRGTRRVHVAGRGWIGYDLASIDIGITSDPPPLPGYSEHAVGAKPLGPFAAAWQRHLDSGDRGGIAVIGGGVGGVELSLAMAAASLARGRPATITVIEAAHALAGTSPRTRRALLRAAGRLGVTVIEGVRAASVGARSVTLSDGREIAARFVVGAAGARPQDWLADTGLDLTDGFVTVDPMLRSASDPAIYAAGDCAHLAHAPRPKAGVFAVRAAPVLAHNLRADLSGGARRHFAPQGDYLKLISLGGQRAVADKWGLTVEGDWVWRLKDRIDRRFMDRLASLPPMAAPPLPREVAQDVRGAMQDPQALCGGCGAKIGAAPLSRVLSRLPPQTAPDLETGAGDDAAVLKIGPHRQVITTDHLRAFVADPALMARITALHALGDIWAMGADPQVALVSIILPQMSERLGERWLDEIMSASAEVFSAEGAAIAGGHTTQGAELTVGFTVTGRLRRPAITLAGARPGDALILTRPIGSGVLLAAEMAGRAHGSDIAALWQTMGRSQSDAARLLSGARAMTDVTGFGLAGHLAAMCRASGTGAAIDTGRVPIYAGAAALADDGVRSTLFSQNRAALGDGVTGPEGPLTDLMFDPQTAGGLLAAVDAASAAPLLTKLRDAGHEAARIGEMGSGPAVLKLA